jgi:hypothetical protein
VAAETKAQHTAPELAEQASWMPLISTAKSPTLAVFTLPVTYSDVIDEGRVYIKRTRRTAEVNWHDSHRKGW